MRKITSILLLAVVLLAFIGPGVYYPIAKVLYRIQMHSWIKTQRPERFERLVFSAQQATDLHLQQEDEFEWQGKRFDVVGKKQEGNQVVVYCINDNEEERMYAKASGTAGKTTQQLEIIKSISLMLYAFSETQIVVAPAAEIYCQHVCYYQSSFSNYKADILSPPPQAVALM